MAKQGEHGISWTEETWNPLRGCTRVSEGCRNCYAERVAARFAGPGMPYEGLAMMTSAGPRWTNEVRLIEERLEDPLRWSKPRRVFVNSMSDLWHEKVSFEEIDRIFAVMALAPQHQFQVLTKRAARMREYFTGLGATAYGAPYRNMMISRHFSRLAWRRGPAYQWSGLPLPNVWLGVSCEDQATADARIPELLATPAAVRWVSAEPLLGPIDVRPWVELGEFTPYGRRPLQWLVVGGESGPGARPMHPQWARDLRDQCQQAGVPFHFKQWGEWLPHSQGGSGHHVHIWAEGRPGTPTAATYRVGKRAAGRLLGGRSWDEYPG